MPTPDAETAQRLRDELTFLRSEQVKGLEQATYLGLTSEGANVLSARRTKILLLQEQLGEE